MELDAWITLVVLVLAFVAFATERVPAALAMGSAVGALLLVGVIDQDQALSGLSSSAPITIAALYVLAGAAAVTGAIAPLVDRVLGDGTTGERRRLARLTATAAGMSAVLPNTPLVALVAPRVVTWARRTGNRASVYLMPLSFAAILGGVVTVIGTSTNLVISDLLRASGDEPLGVFEITSVGLPVAIVGVTVLVVVSPWLLRHRSASAPSMGTARRYTIAMTVERGGAIAGRTVEAAGLRHLQGVFLAGVERGGEVITARPETVLGAGDTCYFAGDVTDIVDLTDLPGLEVAERPHLAGTGDQLDAKLYEVVISERSTLAGSTLADAGFRGRFGAAVLAVRRHDDDLPGKLGTLVLHPGDVLLVLAGPDFARLWGDHGDFSVVAPLAESPPTRPRHGWVVVVAIVGMIALAVSGVLSLMEAALVAAAALLALRVISPTEARRAVNLNVVLTIAASISIGVAVATSGLADHIADALVVVGAPFGEVGTTVALLAATMLLTELLSNNASAALMFPVALATATEAGLDPRTAAIVVLIGASNSFLSPIGYQTNLMIHSLGGYRMTDFARLGLPLSLATLVVVPLAVHLP
ncbi:MAG: SLC13 family permease [Ilumatobacteraceae bacterium]